MSQDTWREVRSKVEGLGLKLKLHLEQESAEDDASAEPGETKKAVEDLGQKIQEAFASFGDAAKDPAVRADVKEIGTLLKDAMAETLSSVSSEVGDTLKKAGDRAKDAKDTAKDTKDTAKDTKDTAKDTVKDTVDDASETITDADAPKPADG